MIIYVLGIFLLLLAGGRPRFRGLRADYLGRESTDAVRGIFILLILASHFVQYLDPFAQPLDLAYGRLRTILGQAVVTLFLYYSGYGVALSADQKGQDYVRAMPAKRIWSTLLVYDCSAMLYLILYLWKGKRYSFGYFLQSLVGWTNYGNSNWYIVAILALYTITWLVLRNRPVNKASAMAVTTATVGLMLALICAGKESWWYDTLLCYPLGMWHYLYKEKIDAFLGKREFNYIVTAACAGALYLGFHKIWGWNLLCYVITMMLFAICVVLFTMKFEIRNPVLIYCGRHLQGLYLVHRIPMIILRDYFDVSSQSMERYIYFALSVALAFLLEAVFTKWMQLMGLGKSRVKTRIAK